MRVKQVRGWVAVGGGAGETSQGTQSVAIGGEAGQTNQGINCVAIGKLAGTTNQHNSTIVLNGTGSALNTGGTDRFVVKPVRDFGAEVGFVALYYNATTGEIAYT